MRREFFFDHALLPSGWASGVRISVADGTLLGTAEHLERHIFKLDAEFLGDKLTRGQDGDALEHSLAAIAEAWRLDGGNFQAAAQLVDDERRQRLTLDILGNDDERLATLHHGLENRQQGLRRRQLLLMHENVWVFELCDHPRERGGSAQRFLVSCETLRSRIQFSKT